MDPQRVCTYASRADRTCEAARELTFLESDTLSSGVLGAGVPIKCAVAPPTAGHRKPGISPAERRSQKRSAYRIRLAARLQFTRVPAADRLALTILIRQ